MLNGRSVICISSIDWDFIWQGHQQIMASLAASGSKVLFIENTGVRRPSFKDVPRLRHRIRNWRRGTKGFREERSNLFVYSPVVLPFPYSRIARWINRSVILNAISRWRKAVDVQRPLVWTFLPTPLARDVIKRVDPELVVYYCIDDLAASSPGASGIRRSEHQLFREADLVFVTSQELKQRAERFRERVDLFPFAVDYDRFAAVRDADDPTPEQLGALPRPIVGYIGGLHRFVDQELMAETARRLPDVSFAFIGPEQCDLTTLKAPSNVHLLGAREHADLPAHIKAFDVGIVPYIQDPYTANVYPTKLNEYLAMGIPVVATGLPEIVHYNEENGAVVTIADEPADFVAAIEESIADDSAGSRERRIAAAERNTWDSRLAGMGELITDALREREAQPANWEARLRGIYQSARRRAFIPLFVVAGLYLLVFHTGFLWFAAAPLRIEDPIRPVDAIVVFAGGVGESGTAGGGYQERVRHAVELYEAGVADEVIFSSGYTFAFREAEIMQDLAVGLGVPAEAITLEESAANTYENVVFSRNILRNKGLDSAAIVSSPYHMRRAMMTWNTQAPDVEAISTPVRTSQFYSESERVRVEQIRGIVWEYAAIVIYWLRGWI